MSIQINENTYRKLIEEDINQLIKWMPENSLEKKHIIDVLMESIDRYENNNICHKCENSL